MYRGMNFGRPMILFVAWCFLLAPGVGYARKLASEELAVIRQNLNAELTGKAKTRFKPSQLISHSELATLQEPADADKGARLYGIFKHKLGVEDASRQEMAELATFVEYMNAWLRRHSAKGQVVYIDHEDTYLRFPLQFYPNGRIYIHLKGLDPKKSEGGYKKFSRTVEYHSERVFAHLVFPINGRHDAQLAMREVDILTALAGNPAVVELHDAGVYWQSVTRGQRRRARLAYEARLYESDLYHLLPAGGRTLSMDATLNLARQMTAAVLGLHDAGVLHRDLKPENMLINYRSDGRVELVLADFGLAENEGPQCGRSYRGTPGYIAPEHCLAATYTSRTFTGKRAGRRGDAYALGAVFLQLIGRGESALAHALYKLNDGVFEGAPRAEIEAAYDTLAQLYEKEREDLKRMPNGVKRRFHDLTLQMLHIDSSERPTLRQVLATLARLERHL